MKLLGTTLTNAVNRYLDADLCALPADVVEKRPTVAWKEYQARRPKPSDIDELFATDGVDGCCILTGTVSGNMEVLDFDGGVKLFEEWRSGVEARVEGLADRLVVSATQSGGRHVAYRCQSAVPGNHKIAQELIEADGPDPVTVSGKPFTPRLVDGRYEALVTLIETRGEGGLVICAPSRGYEVVQGDLCNLSVLTVEERDVLHEEAWKLNRHWPSVGEPRKRDVTDGSRPGDEFNARGDVRPILERHGWTRDRGGTNEYWCRPGKSRGHSATLRDGCFYVFSSNAAPFEPGTPYGPFAVYSLLEHNGDFSAAAATLAADGFGMTANTHFDGGTDGTRPKKHFLSWQPFPTAVLPSLLRRFVVEGARAFGCDPAMVALPTFAMLGGVIGVARVVQLKGGWTEPATLWTAVIARSGSLKSPAQEYALGPAEAIADAMIEDNQAAAEEYERAELAHQAEVEAWKKKHKNRQDCGPAPTSPSKPPSRAVIVDDITTEALIERLSENPRGLIMATDELDAWASAFDCYRGGKGGPDRARWLRLHGARSVRVDRKNRPPLAVKSATCSVIGSLQPGIARKVFDEDNRSSGLVARLLVTLPPTAAKRWTDAEVSVTTTESMDAQVMRLFSLETPEDGLVELSLSHGAREVWIEWYNAVGRAVADTSDDDVAASWGKIEAYAARFALILELVGSKQPKDATTISRESMEAAVRIARWFASEAERVYQILGETQKDRDLRELLEWIKRQGGRTTVRDLMRGPARYRGNRKLAEQDLERAADDGHLRREAHPNGRAGTVYCLRQRQRNNNEFSQDEREVSHPPEALGTSPSGTMRHNGPNDALLGRNEPSPSHEHEDNDGWAELG